MSEPVDVHVGQQIRLRRIAGRMTQAELAKTIGVSLQQVQKYETRPQPRQRIHALLDRQ